MEMLNKILNIFSYIEHFISTYNNSIDRLPEILNNKSEMKASITNIRNSVKKIITFLKKNKEQKLLEQIFLSSNSQFIFLLEIFKIHLTKEYILINNSLTKINYSKFDKAFELKTQNQKVRQFEQKNKRVKSFIWRTMIAHNLIKKCAEDLGIELNSLDYKEIIKEISFPPEYKQAGISILNFFADKVSSDYPDEEVEISIQQIKSKVILVIKPPKGKIKPIIKDFETFGKVISGETSVSSYCENQMQIKLLENKINLAKLEIQLNEKLIIDKRLKDKSLLHNSIKTNSLSFMKDIFKKENTIINIENLYTGDTQMKNESNTYSNITASNIGKNNSIKENEILIQSTKYSNQNFINDIEIVKNILNDLLYQNLKKNDLDIIQKLKNSIDIISEELNENAKDNGLINILLKKSKETINKFVNFSNYSNTTFQNIEIIKNILDKF